MVRDAGSLLRNRGDSLNFLRWESTGRYAGDAQNGWDELAWLLSLRTEEFAEGAENAETEILPPGHRVHGVVRKKNLT